jgi:hypothetical protein
MPSIFEHVIGIIGHPTTPDVDWTDEQLDALRDLGVTTVQLSIAWAWRPAGEVLNLENFEEPGKWDEWRRRAVLAKKHGFQVLAHFGIPVGPVADATTCILDPAVRSKYTGLLKNFFASFPEVTDLLIYTYDQLAWLCSEFGNCPRCHGIPLHERLPGFLEELIDAIHSVRPGVRFWWEPWELSEGQILTILERIRPNHFGLVMHNTIAEVQFVNRTDLSFRNLAAMAARRGIPVIGEGFFGGSGEDVSPLTHLACPRLVYQQLEALRGARGVVGVKEYYGLVPAHFSVNTAIFKAYLHSPESSLEEQIEKIGAGYGPQACEDLIEAWEETAQAMELFPWNASWLLRRIFEHPDGEWNDVPRASWFTPSWQANRRGFYMITDRTDQHPWLLEDVGLRAVSAAKLFERAAEGLAIAAQVTLKADDVLLQLREVRLAAQVAKRFGEQLLAHRAERGISS